MGSGIDAAKNNPEFAQALDNMKDQLLLILVARLGGDVTIPVSEIDTFPVGKIMTMETFKDNASGQLAFRFRVGRKQ